MSVDEKPATPAEQDYLKQIYLLQEDAGRATTQMLADRLGVKPPSVAAMIKKLAEDGNGAFVSHEPYHGVRLTNRGLAVALEMLRHHRLIELFLSELLGVPWDRVHEEADRLEHVLSDDLEERIAAKLGQPDYDPHGDPIPTREGLLPRRSLLPLDRMVDGSDGVIAQVTVQEPEVLQYLAERNLTLGTTLRVVSVDRFGGVVTLTVRDGDATPPSFPIGDELARHILLSTPSEKVGAPE